MKTYKKVLIIFSSILASLGIVVGSFFIQGTCFLKTEPIKNENLKNWMKNIEDDVLLNEIVIPGSHDACTYSMPYLGETQYLNVKEQLEIGVRYFDIRVNKVKGNYKIYHSIINGVTFDPILDDLFSFIQNNQSETLILDFQHFKNGADEYVFNKVKSIFKNYYIENNTSLTDLEFISTLKLKDARGKAIILFGDNSSFSENNNFIFKRNDDSGTYLNAVLDSYYDSSLNGLKSSDYILKGIPSYINKIENKIEQTSYKGLFVLQGQLTDNALIFGPYNKERSHDENMSNYINNLPNESYFNLINIIMRDFINERKAEDIIKLNNIKFNKEII